MILILSLGVILAMACALRLLGWLGKRLPEGDGVDEAEIRRHDLLRGIPDTATTRGGEQPRSSKWPAVRARHLREQPSCQWCLGTKDLQVHHIAPFHFHPELELSDSNLITLCEARGLDCHLVHGHNGNFRDFNPGIARDCAAHSGKGAA
jgi:hypothetical protein